MQTGLVSRKEKHLNERGTQGGGQVDYDGVEQTSACCVMSDVLFMFYGAHG
jgi:hypothetical protein